jgi:two-component system response regulator HydG
LESGWSADTLGLIGQSQVMDELRQAIRRVAASPYPVLVTGESGCGKELVAKAVHLLSRRPERRFGAVNCASLTDELAEAELFGCTRGAFTGAVADRTGLFEAVDQGTLFLDEVGELSARPQTKLLRTLQDGEIRRVGDNRPRKVDVRVIGATNRQLEEDVASGRFREDLWYRLDVLRLRVPPLRERGEDVGLLAEHFWRKAQQVTGSHATPSRSILAALQRHEWPGNVRQLENVVASLVVGGPRRGVINPDALPTGLVPDGPGGDVAQTLSEARFRFERRYVSGALARARGRRGQAASALGVTRQGLAKLLKRLDLDQPPSELSRTSG